MPITATEVFDKLKQKLGEGETRLRLQFFEERFGATVATKADIGRVEERLQSSASLLEDRVHAGVNLLLLGRDDAHPVGGAFHLSSHMGD